MTIKERWRTDIRHRPPGENQGAAPTRRISDHHFETAPRSGVADTRIEQERGRERDRGAPFTKTRRLKGIRPEAVKIGEGVGHLENLSEGQRSWKVFSLG